MLPLGMIHIFAHVLSGYMLSQSSLPATAAEISVMIYIYELKCLKIPILCCSERNRCLMFLMIISNF